MKDIEMFIEVLNNLNIDCTDPVSSPREYITRDMAIDAGDKDLEGQIYKEETWERCGSCANCMFNQVRPDIIAYLNSAEKKD